MEKKKVLLVDDDAAILALLASKLGTRYDVVATSQPAQVLELVKRERPHLVLCDIDMPDMSGGDVAAELASHPETADIPLIYLTALVTPEETRELEGDVGGRPGVSKRAPLGELVARIESLLNS